MMKTVITLFLAFLVAGSPLVAGVVFQVETTYHSGSPGSAQSSRMSVQGKDLKMEILPGKGKRGEMVFRGDRREMVVIDHDDKAYMVIDEAAIKSIGGQMSEAMKELEKKLSQLDPKQREMMEKMLKGRMGGASAKKRQPSEFRRSGERAHKRGYPCVKYDVLRDGQKTSELWVTDWSNVRGGSQVRGTFRELADFFAEISESFQSLRSSGMDFLGGENSVIESFKHVDGFPVVTRTFEGGGLDGLAA